MSFAKTVGLSAFPSDFWILTPDFFANNFLYCCRLLVKALLRQPLRQLLRRQRAFCVAHRAGERGG